MLRRHLTGIDGHWVVLPPSTFDLKFPAYGRPELRLRPKSYELVTAVGAVHVARLVARLQGHTHGFEFYLQRSGMVVVR